MKHLKPYQLYESQSIINASIENAINNNNIELFKDLTIQYNDMVDYESIVDRIWDDYDYRLLSFFKHIPLEYKTHITELSYNDIGIKHQVDISGLPYLETLNCYLNDLTELDVSKNTMLKFISCDNNNLTTLDISNNPELVYLSCYNNELTALDISKNTKLKELLSGSNEITSLDVSNNPKLNTLYIDNNNLTTLDISNNPKLEHMSYDRDKVTINK